MLTVCLTCPGQGQRVKEHDGRARRPSSQTHALHTGPAERNARTHIYLLGEESKCGKWLARNGFMDYPEEPTAETSETDIMKT